MINLPDIRKANVNGKRVFLRADLDVPMVNGKIEDDTRLRSCLPTIEYLLKQNAKIILAGHLGRPQGFDKTLSLEPVARWLQNKFSISNLQFSKRGEFEGWEIGPNIFLLENLRFNEGERANSSEFVKKLASLANLYVDDAFAVCHRDNASITGVPKHLPHFAGFQLQKEVEALSEVLENPKRPLAVIIGGAKLETKLPLVEKMRHVADYVLVGGKIAGETKELLKIQHEKIIGKKLVLLVADLNQKGTDITPKSVENFLQIINLAKTVVWNGPMGKISENKSEILGSEDGTRRLVEGIVKSGAYVVVGGGDTIGFLEKNCFLNAFTCLPKTRSHLSMGGGAMLGFLSGEKLPGVEALL
ncbi:MAG: phosphoglycerate kinase [Candidatus Levybacteria bacterium]|nr:phosphoglycerate kinase [Candidatus Levybacteria bacterium]MDZ4228289.1 phosphoglycerate kinase [Candidatus Levybacteria bacterium]